MDSGIPRFAEGVTCPDSRREAHHGAPRRDATGGNMDRNGRAGKSETGAPLAGKQAQLDEHVPMARANSAQGLCRMPTRPVAPPRGRRGTLAWGWPSVLLGASAPPLLNPGKPRPRDTDTLVSAPVISPCPESRGWPPIGPCRPLGLPIRQGPAVNGRKRPPEMATAAWLPRPVPRVEHVHRQPALWTVASVPLGRAVAAERRAPICAARMPPWKRSVCYTPGGA